jgi:hypothetical protein
LLHYPNALGSSPGEIDDAPLGLHVRPTIVDLDLTTRLRLGILRLQGILRQVGFGLLLLGYILRGISRSLSQLCS